MTFISRRFGRLKGFELASVAITGQGKAILAECDGHEGGMKGSSIELNNTALLYSSSGNIFCLCNTVPRVRILRDMGARRKSN